MGCLLLQHHLAFPDGYSRPNKVCSCQASCVVCIFFCCASGRVPVPLLYRGSYPQFSRWGRREKDRKETGAVCPAVISSPKPALVNCFAFPGFRSHPHSLAHSPIPSLKLAEFSSHLLFFFKQCFDSTKVSVSKIA